MRPVFILLSISLFIISCAFIPTVLLGQASSAITGSDTSKAYSITDGDINGNFQNEELTRVEDSLNNLYWINAGLGVPSLGIDLNINYAMQKVLITADVARVVKYNNNEFWDGVDKDCSAYGILLGAYKNNKNNFASISTGVSYVVGLDRTEPEAYNPGTESVKFRTIGLPVKAQFSLHGKYIGIGISGILNINKNMPYGLVMLSLSFGKLKRDII